MPTGEPTVPTATPTSGAVHTKDVLAVALREVGLVHMADVAATGYYHDFLSPLATPELQLVADLREAAVRNPGRKEEIKALAARVVNGDFDATKEESDAWAASPEGQETFRGLTRR